MSSRIAELTSQNHRRIILKLLSKQKDYKAANYDIWRAMNDLQLSISVDKVTTELHWLMEQGFVNELGGDLLFVRLTDRGFDIVKQNSFHPGIEVPLPGQQ